ncbi:uncharacterized protein LOC142975271 [Anticarsia gemmatalis]|uniref:uncharacterized protein LOC142975271 n=1 Tax=Anticarsia gemmatalis TaxID=129554 RepID=UPI003F776038
MDPDSEEILKAVHSTKKFTVLSRQATHQMFMPNIGYLISSEDVISFTEYFEYLIREPAWNPYAKFLIVIKSLGDVDMRIIFDELLKQHVNNALIVNGTEDANLYTYNPFDKYACGRYYDTVISYGLCSQATNNLYPNKLITGLQKCNFTASLAHRPPLSIDPLKIKEEKKILATEEYIITLLGEVERFTVNFNYSYNGDLFSTVAPNMTAFGPMEMLQKNECDIIFGGMMMVTSRAEAFTYLCGYHDYGDDLVFAVKRSSLVPIWKYIYLEFELDVWAVLLVIFLVYSIIAAILLRTKDGGDIVLRLLDNLLLHGRDTRTRFSVKCILITWVWFSYLINTFYQSSLFSLTTQPSLDFQVSDEDDIMKYDFQPCFSHALRKYLFTETNKLSKTGNFRNEGCETTLQAMDTISKTANVFTLN